jgi:hypothetical protein
MQEKLIKVCRGRLNGAFEFESAPGRGTTIRMVIPFR